MNPYVIGPYTFNDIFLRQPKVIIYQLVYEICFEKVWKITLKLIVYIVGHLTDLYKVVFLIHTSCWNSVLRVQSSQLLELPGNMHTTRHTQSSNYLVCNRSQVEDRLKSNPAVAIAGVLNPGSLFLQRIHAGRGTIKIAKPNWLHNWISSSQFIQSCPDPIWHC